MNMLKQGVKKMKKENFFSVKKIERAYLSDI